MENEIRELAYEIWENRQYFGIEGTAEDDWLQAEREINARYCSNSIDYVNAFKMYHIRGGY